ncbi:mediator complex subunit 13 C-terminal-domain-containing protein [Verticillium dahliae]|nr:mediator complex subunit 13 C-terminal-domain-containing protein [Verticillium dahliae]
MDTSQYGTNIFLIKGISSIAYQLYEPAPEQAQAFASIAPTIEKSLRDAGRVAHFDTSRRALWHFYIPRHDATQPTAHTEEGGALDHSLDVAGFNLVLTDEGSFEPGHLFKSRPIGQRQTAANTPTHPAFNGSVPDATLRNASSFDNTNTATPSSSDPEGKPTPITSSDGKISITVKIAYEQFISAMLSTVSSPICRSLAAIPLNHCTILLNSKIIRQGESKNASGTETAVLGIFRIYLTTNGTLVISFSLVLSEGLISMHEVPGTGQAALSSQVLAAPFGVLGSYMGLANGALPYADTIGQTPDTRLWRPRPEPDAKSSQWREICTGMLKGWGLSGHTLQNCTWVALQLSPRKPVDLRAEGRGTPVRNSSPPMIFSWPSILCFRKRSVDPQANQSERTDIALASKEAADSLTEVKTWFQSGTEREESIVQRRKAREAVASAKEAQAQAPAAPQPTDQFPMDPRRAANAAAASAMYPTPPDAVQNPLGIFTAPAADAVTSSPGPPSSVAAPVDGDAPMVNAVVMADTEPDSWEQTDTKRDRVDSTFEGDGNLFGDMGPDMFGDTDITDADFSFFDEDDDNNPLDLNMSAPDTTMTSLPTTTPEPVLSQADILPPTIDEISEETKPKMEAPIFTKPELRHARSTLNDETRGRPTSEISKALSNKREPSPFDPATVFKKVRASLGRLNNQSLGSPSTVTARKGSVFDSIEFDPVLPLASKKYEQGGRFACRWTPTQSDTSLSLKKPPTTDYLRRHSKLHRKPFRTDNTNARIRSITDGLENSSLQASPDKIEELSSDADDMSLESDVDESPDLMEEPTSPFKASTKRLNLEDDMVSHVTSLRDVESVVEDSDPSLPLELPRIARFEVPEVAVAKYFDDPEPLLSQLSLQDDDIITVAQILTEQAISGNLCLRDAQSATFNSPVAPETRRQLASLSRTLSLVLQQAIPAALGDSTQCRFRELIEASDVPLLGPPSRAQPRPVPPRDPNAEPPKPNYLFQIPPPHLEIRRLDSKLSVLPSTISFWETLGLGPSQGVKNITAACVFPNLNGLSDFATTFLGRIRNTYEFLKLGGFDIVNGESGHTTGGLVPWEEERLTGTPTVDGAMHGSSLADRMDSLNQSLLSLEAREKNFVVFIVYIPSHPESIVEACTAFQQLFELHKKALADKRLAPSNELALQLLPVDFLTAVSGMPTALPIDLIKLALETYDRCTIFGGPMPAPAILLEHTLPRNIDFRLNNTGSSSLMHENTCIHIAYAQSVDERWITAAWTDNRGSQQMTASYNLGRKGKSLSSSLNEVTHEIWETTHDLISRWKVHWRIIITKCGCMDQSEIDFWVGLAQTEQQASVSLTLITVDTSPSLQLVPPAVKVPPTASTSFYTTPVSTPQPSTVSPDQIGTPSTPMKDGSQANASTPTGTPGGADVAEPAEGDAILVDVTDQTWGAVLSHRLGNSTAPGELSTSLISGYLVKRGGTKVEDPPVVMEVNIVYTDGNPRALEALLREMLNYFRGLGTLARARGMVDRETDVRPWHIAAAEKGVRALYLLM